MLGFYINSFNTAIKDLEQNYVQESFFNNSHYCDFVAQLLTIL